MRMKYPFLCIVLACIVLPIRPTPVYSIIVPDFRVNTDSALGIAQAYPDIAFDSMGNFVIVYKQ